MASEPEATERRPGGGGGCDATDVPAGYNLYFCLSNTWTQMANGIGGGSVSSVATGCGLTGGPVTATGTVQAYVPVVAKTGSYTIADSDCGELLTVSSASGATLTLPQAGASSHFAAGWYIRIQNLGSSGLTVTTGTSTFFAGGGYSGDAVHAERKPGSPPGQRWRQLPGRQQSYSAHGQRADWHFLCSGGRRSRKAGVHCECKRGCRIPAATWHPVRSRMVHGNREHRSRDGYDHAHVKHARRRRIGCLGTESGHPHIQRWRKLLYGARRRSGLCDAEFRIVEWDNDRRRHAAEHAKIRPV